MSKFKLGDYVTNDLTGKSGFVVGINLVNSWTICQVQIENGDVLTMTSNFLSLPQKACDCGGAITSGTHSHWCSNPADNGKRQTGFVRKHLRLGDPED